MSRKRRSTLVLLLLFLLLLLLIAITQCDERLGPTPEPVAAVCTRMREQEVFGTTPYYVERQVILTGRASAFRPVEEDLDLELLVDCDLSYLANLSGREQITLQTLSLPPQLAETSTPSSFDTYNRIVGQLGQRPEDALALRLYLVPTEQNVPDVVERINAEHGPNVFAEPNYLTGHLAQSPCSNPPGTQGKPFSVEGSPFSVEGSLGGGIGLDADPEAFWEQWAFERIGAGTYKDPDIQQRGAGVRVGVFDTSPFTETSVISITDINPALNLHVTVPATATVLTPTETISPTIEDHGLFVAGLVYGVAPGSEIHLIRVLDENGCGDLFALSQALHEFAAAQSDEEGRLDGVVINMSLGVLQPRDIGSEEPSNPETEAFPEDILALQTAVLEAYQRGAVLVAAAGNDSVGDNHRFAMELPAAYEYVIGVAASDSENQPACYSNQGDVVAPGGGAEPDLTQDPPRCLAYAHQCPLDPEEPGECDHGLISLATTSSTEYAYWVGTSFATPLVSGVAALAYDGGSQAQVYNDIFNGLQPIGTDFGPGIVNVANSLSP